MGDKLLTVEFLQCIFIRNLGYINGMCVLIKKDVGK